MILEYIVLFFLNFGNETRGVLLFWYSQEGSAASPEKMVYIQNVDEEGYLPEIY